MFKYTKRIIAAFICLTVLFSLCGCGGKSVIDTISNNPTTRATTETKIEEKLVETFDETTHKWIVATNEDGSPKAVYLDLNAFALREPKYEQTHIVKQSLPKDVRESMTKEQLDAMPILGGMKPLVNPSANAATASNVPFAQPTEADSDLPF